MRRGVCGCRRPVTDLGDCRGPRWVHDQALVGHRVFAVTKVTAS